MLYVHCGLHRTATTSFQAVLSARQNELAAAGVIYPDRWRLDDGDAHHGLIELLRSSPNRDAEIADFHDYVAARADKTILLSSEQLTVWLDEPRRAALLDLLLAARSAMPVTCVWTLRSFDRTFASLNLRQMMFGFKITSADEYSGALEGAIVGMRLVEDALGTESVYVRYDSGGAHCAEILDRCGVPEVVGRPIMEDLRRRPHVNSSMSRKKAAAVLHIDAVSARAGVPIDRQDLAALFHAGEFRFEDDEPCEVVEKETRRSLHEEALRASRKHGLSPYIDFYEDLEIRGGSPQPLEPSLLTDGDVEHLVNALGDAEIVSIGPRF
jgi:hypothetical protein